MRDAPSFLPGSECWISFSQGWGPTVEQTCLSASPALLLPCQQVTYLHMAKASNKSSWNRACTWIATKWSHHGYLTLLKYLGFPILQHSKAGKELLHEALHENMQQALLHPPIISETGLSTENNCYCLLRSQVPFRRMLTLPESCPWIRHGL